MCVWGGGWEGEVVVDIGTGNLIPGSGIGWWPGSDRGW